LNLKFPLKLEQSRSESNIVVKVSSSSSTYNEQLPLQQRQKKRRRLKPLLMTQASLKIAFVIIMQSQQSKKRAYLCWLVRGNNL
jgi:hypothetical protein